MKDQSDMSMLSADILNAMACGYVFKAIEHPELKSVYLERVFPVLEELERRLAAEDSHISPEAGDGPHLYGVLVSMAMSGLHTSYAGNNYAARNSLAQAKSVLRKTIAS